MQHRSARPGRGCRAYRSPPREVPLDTGVPSDRPPIATDRDPPALRGASARVEYMIRPARITDIERLVALSGGSLRSSALRDRWTRGTCSDSWSISRRRASSSPRPGARSSEAPCSPFDRPSRRRLRRSRGPHRGRSRSRRGPRHRRAPGGDPPFGAQQGLHRRRGGPAGRPGGADPPGASRIRRIRSARGTAGGRGRGRRAPAR